MFLWVANLPALIAANAPSPAAARPWLVTAKLAIHAVRSLISTEPASVLKRLRVCRRRSHAQRRFTCAATGADCTALRYHCTRRPDVDLCPAAFAEGRFPAGTCARDFVRMDAGAKQAAQVGNFPWLARPLLVNPVVLQVALRGSSQQGWG